MKAAAVAQPPYFNRLFLRILGRVFRVWRLWGFVFVSQQRARATPSRGGPGIARQEAVVEAQHRASRGGVMGGVPIALCPVARVFYCDSPVVVGVQIDSVAHVIICVARKSRDMNWFALLNDQL